MERDEPSSSKTVTITSPRNGKAKPIRLNNKTKADAYNKVKKRESEMSYSSITDVKASSETDQIDCIEPVSLLSGFNMDTNQPAILMMSTVRFNMINSQRTSFLQCDITLFQEIQDLEMFQGFMMFNAMNKHELESLRNEKMKEESSKMKFYSENKKYYIFHKTRYEKFMARAIWNSTSPHISTTDSLQFFLQGKADASDIKLEYIELRSKISFIYSSNLIVDVGLKKRLHIDMYLAEDSTKYIERVKALGKVYDELFDEIEKSILNVGNDKITKQRSGKKEKIEWWNKVITEKKRLISQCLKEVVQQENYFQKENQLTEQEKTELVDQLKEYMLKERESDLQKEDELKEKVKAELPADNILFHRTKVRNAKSKMNTSSLYRAFNLYRKNVLERELLSVEQLREALYSIKSPHYIWPSGHPLILSKERQIEPDFSSNEHMERLHSFVNGTNRRHRTWNSDQIVRPEPMVLAGFSYDGEDDKVVCKSCGAISDVNDWSDDDEDYAFTMHRRTGSSHCEFLRIFDPRRSKM